jgi:hypothetical protein
LIILMPYILLAFIIPLIYAGANKKAGFLKIIY